MKHYEDEYDWECEESEEEEYEYSVLGVPTKYLWLVVFLGFIVLPAILNDYGVKLW